MQVEYTITENEYVKANRLYTKPTVKVVAIYSAFALCAIILAIFTSSLLIGFAAAGGLMGGIIGHLVTRHLYAPWKTRKQYQEYQAAQESVILSKEKSGLHFKSKLGEANIEWQRIFKWRENNSIVLIYQAPEVYHIIPKRVGSIVKDITSSLNREIGNAT